MDAERALLRHTVATVAYRGAKALRGAPDNFGTCRVGEGSRTPADILAHLGDLFGWALSLAEGAPDWRESTPRPWSQEVGRFFETLRQLDAYLASDAPLGCSPGQLFQGPIADALTHVGQLTIMRRVAGAPIRLENYFKADIVAGRVGPDQTAARREFD